MKIENIKISTALYLLTGIFTIIMALNGLFAVKQLNKIRQGTETIFNDKLTPIGQLREMSDKLSIDIVNATYEMNHNTLSWPEGVSNIKTAMSLMRDDWQDYVETKIEGEELVMKDEAEKLMSVAMNSVEKLLEIASNKNETSANEFNLYIENHLYKDIDPFIAHVKKLMNLQFTLAQKVYLSSEQTYTKTIVNLVILFLIGIIISISASLFISYRLNKALKFTNSIIEKISHGDLNVKIGRSGKDEIGVLLGNIRNMVTKLKEVVTFIYHSTHRLTDSDQNLNKVAQDISMGANQQASSIEEISASIEEMSANIKQNLMNARMAETIAVNVAGEMESVLKSSSTSITKIKEIAEKITVVSDIAFQTNILALNAAIEAARAGVHGKGFSVVAAEVGHLAEKSRQAAADINELAVSSVSATEYSGKLLEKIIPDILKTSHFVQEITAANHEQSIGAEQINIGIQQLNNMTQSYAAVSEELSSGSADLLNQSQELLDMISYFKVE